jgi:catechol 2,3-dioxygenase-like lactoylglutathione lyase family enzyme
MKPSIDQQITFLHAENLEQTKTFYTNTLGFPLLRDQGTCLIFGVNKGAYLGFCFHIEKVPIGRNIILTLVSDEVDEWYERLKSKDCEILEPPNYNSKYQIYHFFFKDPDGYWIEIQKFDQPLEYK